MKKLNLYQLFQFGQMMRFFDRLTPQTKLGDIKTDCELASMWFEWLLRHEHLPTAGTAASVRQLKTICDQLRDGNGDETLGRKHEIISYFSSKFESVFEAELVRSDIYFITPIGGYSTETLLSSGRSLLHESTVNWISEEAIEGFEEGTRSVALKQATAAGFQLLRSVEAVMHQYYDVISNGAERPKTRNMGLYIEAMEKIVGIDKRMLEVLRGIKNLRRNPLAHPEDFLEMKDALIILDITKSSISTMAQLAQEHSGKGPKAALT
jgi:hypothetical protein